MAFLLKALSAKADDMNSITGTPIIEGKNLLSQVVV